jgi:Dual specificity phosphatase, catalytic domain
MVNEILPNLFLGGESDSFSACYELIVNCTPDLPFMSSVPTHSCIRISVKDNDDPEQQAILYNHIRHTNTLERIRNTLIEGGNVLVHCRHGQQRSAAVIAAYIMYAHHVKDWKTSVNIVGAKRHEAFFAGNVNFKEALVKWSQYLSQIES